MTAGGEAQNHDLIDEGGYLTVSNLAPALASVNSNIKANDISHDSNISSSQMDMNNFANML